ncbi:MAG: immunoglobulin domain-containing protein, partial [Verrucomicrobiota bacterium]
ASAVQPDGKVLVGGSFSSFNRLTRNNLTRLQPDGTNDLSFNIGLGFDGSVFCIAPQSDGKILVGGDFRSFNGNARIALARLQPNGALDSSFDAQISGIHVLAIAFQDDGKILIGGAFQGVQNAKRNALARLHADGTLDTTFVPTELEFDVIVQALGIQSDGKIVIGGPQARRRLSRLNTDGTIDTTFKSGTGPDAGVRTLCIEPNDKIILGGDFRSYNGATANRLIRLNFDGSIDQTFEASGTPAGTVDVVTRQADGRILVAGSFSTFNGVSRKGLTRLFSDPEVPGPPIFTKPLPATLEIAEGADLTLGATILSSTPVAVSWSKDGVPVSASRRIPDAVSGTLLIAGVQIEDGGRYSLGVTNSSGVSTSECEVTVLPGARTPGAVDFSFFVQPNSRNTPRRCVEQADGKVLVAGFITEIESRSVKNVVRFHPDGSNDRSFESAMKLQVAAMALQTDGRILLGVDRRFGSSSTPEFLVRLLQDGKVDPTFAEWKDSEGSIFEIVFSSNGKALIGGSSRDEMGMVRPILARITPDGQIERNFSHLLGSMGQAYQLLELADDFWMIGGRFRTPAPANIESIALLDAEGMPDPNWRTFRRIDQFPIVQKLARQADGKLVISGTFKSIAGIPRPGFARLHADGTLDETFQPSDHYSPTTLRFQSDGKLIAVVSTNLLRLHWNGSLDENFQAPRTSGSIHDVQVLKDGKLLVVGTFTNWHGYNLIVRLHNDAPSQPPSPPQVVLPPQEVTAPEGAIAKLTVTAIGRDPLKFEWLRNGEPIPSALQASGVNTSTLTFPTTTRDTVGEYSVRVSDGTSSVLSPSASLNVIPPGQQAGDLDLTFSRIQIYGFISKVRLQPDGKFIVLGGFTEVNDFTRRHMARLNADGTLDPSFDPGEGPSVPPMDCVTLPDGSIVVVGPFETFGGLERIGVARLDRTGAVDGNFVFHLQFAKLIAFTPSQQLLIGGSFWQINGEPWKQLVRINLDGTIDRSFARLDFGHSDYLDSMLVLPNNQVLLGISSGSSSSLPFLVRLNSDGKQDNTFRPTITSHSVNAIAVDDSGRILIAKTFQTVNGVAQKDLARLHPDGSLDSTFSVGLGANNPIRDLLVLPDGKLVASGEFTTFQGVPTPGMVVLNSDGSIDTHFVRPRPNDMVFSLATTGDGRLIACGAFSTFNDYHRDLIAALRLETKPGIAPRIVEQPKSRSLPIGSEARFEVQVIGDEPLTFQWLKNGQVLPGQNARVLVLSNISRLDGGLYEVEIANASGKETSTKAQLHVVGPQRFHRPEILSQSMARLTFSEADGTPTSGATASTLVLEASTDLHNWEIVNASIFVTEDHYSVEVPFDRQSRFYRLLFK